MPAHLAAAGLSSSEGQSTATTFLGHQGQPHATDTWLQKSGQSQTQITLALPSPLLPEGSFSPGA